MTGEAIASPVFFLPYSGKDIGRDLQGSKKEALYGPLFPCFGDSGFLHQPVQVSLGGGEASLHIR